MRSLVVVVLVSVFTVQNTIRIENLHRYFESNRSGTPEIEPVFTFFVYNTLNILWYALNILIINQSDSDAKQY